MGDARHLRTPPGRFLSPQGIDALLDAEAKRVEEYFPGLEFRLVPLRGGINFNFVEVPKLAGLLITDVAAS